MSVDKMTQVVMRFDRVWREMLAEGKPLVEASDRQCDACGEVKRAALASPAGRCVCHDCHDLTTSEGWFGIATRHPQWDDLLRLPASPKFVKKFT